MPKIGDLPPMDQQGAVYFPCENCGGPAEYPFLNDGLCNQCAKKREAKPDK